MSLPYNSNLIPTAKALRRNATKQERHLWYDFLRNYPVRFQRQKTLDRFIADFFCAAAKLVVEVDGSQHYTERGMTGDRERSDILAQYGVEGLRFSNAEIDQCFEGVCQQIDFTVRKRISEM